MPFIIWGTRGITSTSHAGRFYCPQCNRERNYAHKSVRRFFTIFFIPLIPLDLVGEYVECQVCHGTFKPQVINFDPRAAQKRFEAEFQVAVKRVLVQMALADGEIDDKEVDSIREVYTKVTNMPITHEEVESEIEVARNDGRGVQQFLSKMAGTLNANGKEMVLQAAFFVAGADGEFQQEEVALLESIGKALGMSSAHITGVMQQMATQLKQVGEVQQANDANGANGANNQLPEGE